MKGAFIKSASEPILDADPPLLGVIFPRRITPRLTQR
jgi:hypothetical protein